MALLKCRYIIKILSQQIENNYIIPIGRTVRGQKAKKMDAHSQISQTL